MRNKIEQPMKPYKFILAFLACIFCCLLFTTCKKEITKSDYTGNANSIKVFDLKGDFPYAQIKRLEGGYFLVYGENVNRQKDVSVAVTDDDGNVIHKTTFGGTRAEAIWCSQVDAQGNLYLGGLTRSSELRMDKNAKTTTTSDGYLAKLDKDGNLLWQRGYCDTTSKSKGIREDGFYSAYLINNKLYCIGGTGSWHTPAGNGQTEYDLWVVTFDENGKVLKDRILPSLRRGKSLSNSGGIWIMEAIRLGDNDLICRHVFTAYQSSGQQTIDTTSLLLRYNIAADSVLWTRYYRQASPQGDLAFGGLLANGNMAFFDSYWNIINIIDVINGNVISSTTVNKNTASPTSNQYFMILGTSPFTINENLYFLGYNSKGGTTANQKPFAAKLNREGTLVYNKIFEMPGYFYWVSELNNKNLRFMGGVNVFNTDNIKLFTMTTDENGNVINP